MNMDIRIWTSQREIVKDFSVEKQARVIAGGP